MRKKTWKKPGKNAFLKKTFWYLRMSLVPSKILKILRSRMTFSRPSAFMNPFPPSTCSHSKTLTLKGTPTKSPTSKGPASKGPRYERSGGTKGPATKGPEERSGYIRCGFFLHQNWSRTNYQGPYLTFFPKLVR